MLDWLKRPGQEECGNRWPLIRKFNYELTGCELPDNMPSEEWRQVDVVFQRKIVRCYIYKLNEKQHFNAHRAVTIKLYPTNFAITFSIDWWLSSANGNPNLRVVGSQNQGILCFPEQNRRQRNVYFVML